MQETVSRALELDKSALGKLISLFEDPRPVTAPERQQIQEELDERSTKNGVVLGFTGTPGAGKSTLIGQLAQLLLLNRPGVSAAVLAVDPTSPLSHGALLGDRTRVRFPVGERNLFFRSQSSRLHTGGLSPVTFQVTNLLRKLFDFIFLETVGTGQNETDIRHFADRIYLVLQPLGGDQIQFMKAGIMEIPHVVILNKADEKVAALKTFHTLENTLQVAAAEGEEILLYRTSATTGTGLAEVLADCLGAAPASPGRLRAREDFFFREWVREQFGQLGTDYLDGTMSRAATEGQSFASRQQVLFRNFINSIKEMRTPL